MKILITNDDGWQAPGIGALMEVAVSLGDCFLIGPASPQSGISHQLTLNRPIEIVEHANQVYSVDGTPADCVRLGLTHLSKKLGVDFDVVLSGINNGGNLGADIYVSGTVAATREAALFGVKAIALSQHRLRFKESFDWTHSKSAARKVLDHCLNQSDWAHGNAREFLNVNLPDFSDHDSIPDFEIVDPSELDRHPLPAIYKVDERPESEKTIQLTYDGKYNDRPREPGKDIATCFAGNVPITRHRV